MNQTKTYEMTLTETKKSTLPLKETLKLLEDQLDQQNTELTKLYDERKHFASLLSEMNELQIETMKQLEIEKKKQEKIKNITVPLQYPSFL